MNDLLEVLEKLRKNNPLVHTIANHVTANDCANLLLAIGASPIMADAPQEMEAITSLSQVTVLNLGTPNDTKYQAVMTAGRKANELNHPVIIDPVGVGVSDYRLQNMTTIFTQVQPSIIRANVGEVQSLLGERSLSRGVDSYDTQDSSGIKAAIKLAKKMSCVILMTGKEDFITDGVKHYTIHGGSPRFKQITGTGDMLSVLCGAFATVTTPILAAVYAAYIWKVIGEAALKESNGLGQARISLFDYAENMKQLIKETNTVTVHSGGTIYDN